jgi:AAA15 family ATPase/GTPase
MINKLYIENFKSFQKFNASWGPFNILVGANNSGKTTIFHAFNFIFWLLEKTAHIEDRTVHFEKAQVTEFRSIPCMEPRDIYFQQKIRAGRGPLRIVLELSFNRNATISAKEKKLHFEIYQAYARNFMLDGTGSPKLWHAE